MQTIQNFGYDGAMLLALLICAAVFLGSLGIPTAPITPSMTEEEVVGSRSGRGRRCRPADLDHLSRHQSHRHHVRAFPCPKNICFRMAPSASYRPV